MQLNLRDIQQLCELAKKTSVEAGQYIAGVDRRTLSIDRKDIGTSLSSQVVTEVDRHCDQLIRDRLQESCDRFGLVLLTEENSEEQERQKKIDLFRITFGVLTLSIALCLLLKINRVIPLPLHWYQRRVDLLLVWSTILVRKNSIML